MEPVWNKYSQKWTVVINGQHRFYDFYEDALRALCRAA